MSTDSSTEPPITGDKDTNITHSHVLESEAANMGPVGKAEDRASKERGGNPDSPLPSDGIHVPSEGLHDESQHSPILNTLSAAPESQAARDYPGSGGKQIHNAPSRVDDPAANGNEDQSRTAQDRTHRWQTQQLTGWAAVEKTLTDFDQQEVSGYKEDIDSLLTFAGLYSGVLTAFVIVSFTQLQEDTAAESLKVLRIIANQTAGNAISNQPVTAATTLAATPPFQPSLSAKRVNVLWFASLIISLSTASLSILVKQWLRGYLAFASSSPQGQLRIRHFRRSGLETWRVFGIAAMLPLLLQISLALFFVGLCFFTADIDPAIGNTALPLVCAWAFLFIVVTISPVFSARCPYKTPALSAITTALRVHVWYNARRYAWVVFAISLMILLLAFWRMLKLIRGTFGIWQNFVRAYQECVEDMMEKIEAIIDEPREEEVEYLNKATNDLAILVAADAVQANLELDLVIMEDALKQSNPKWDEVVNFLVQIMGNRIPLQSKFAKGPQTGLIDCRLLSTRTKAGIRGFLNHYVIDNNEFNLASSIQEIGDKPSWDSLSPFQQWTTCVFLSLCEPDAGVHILDVLHPLVLAAWFDHTIQDREIVNRSIRDGGTVAVFTSLCLWINLGYTARSLPQSLDGIRGILSSMIYELNAQRDAQNQQGNLSISTTLGNLTSTAARNFGNIVFSDYWKKHTEVGHLEDRCDAVLALCRIAEYMGGVGLYKEVFTPFVKESFLQRSYAMVEGILTSLFGLPFSSDESWHRTQGASNCLFLLEIAAESQSSEAYTHIVNALCIIANRAFVSSNSAEDFLHFCATALQFLKFEPHELVIIPDRNLWRRLFLLLLPFWVQIHRSLEQGFSFSLCIGEQKCLSDLVSIGEEVDNLLSAHIEESLELSAEQRRNSPIPDIFCLALGTLVEEEGKPPIWTAKHLRDISPQERETIIAEGKVEFESALQAVKERANITRGKCLLIRPSPRGG